MKIITENRYLKTFSFFSSKELKIFLDNLDVKQKLVIENDDYGENYYCCLVSNSLTNEKDFILTFSSDEKEDNLNFIFWKDLIVLDTGRKIYLIDKYLNILKSFEITTPLIGMYLINENNLLLFEEAYLRIIDFQGRIVKEELYDLVENFQLKENVLFIQTSEGDKEIELL